LKVVLTSEAEADLEQIGDYIAADNPMRALSFVRELRRRCESLSYMGSAFPLVPRYKIYGYRRFPHKSYLIFYRVSDDAVEVLHILHGARDIDALLFPGEDQTGAGGCEP